DRSASAAVHVAEQDRDEGSVAALKTLGDAHRRTSAGQPPPVRVERSNGEADLAADAPLDNPSAAQCMGTSTGVAGRSTRELSRSLSTSRGPWIVANGKWRTGNEKWSIANRVAATHRSHGVARPKSLGCRRHSHAECIK